jgi:hypothetical protein
VVDLTEQERAAMRAALRPVAELMEEIEAAIGGFQEAMAASAAQASTEIPF